MKTAIATLLALVCASAAFAQTATVTGRVTDPDRAVVMGAEVTLVEVSSGVQDMTKTTGDGQYRFDVRPGRYLLMVMAPGFGMFSEEIEVTATGRVVDAGLRVAGLTEEVTVVGIATNPSIGRTRLPLRDQPITLNVVTAEQIKSQGINDLVTALQFVNNVNAYQQYGVYEHYQFRGFSDVVQMVDGIRNEGNRVRSQLSNVERVEVLKGPASVLYGSDSLGATMNIVLKQPSAQPSYDFSTSAGSWNTYRGSFGATGRLGMDRLLYRVDAGVESADNFRHDPWKRANVTPSLQMRLGRADRLDVRYSLHRNDVSGDSGLPLVTRPDGSTFIADVPRDRRFNTPGDFALSHDHNIRASYGHTFSNGMGIRNISAYRLFDDEYWVAETLRVTYPRTVNREFLYFKHKRRPFVNQVEFSGPVRLGVNHDLLLGWDHQTYNSRTTRATGASLPTTAIDLYSPVETHQDSRFNFAETRYDYFANYTNGFYIQDHITVLPQVKAVLGARFDDLRRYTHNNPVANGVETEVAAVRRNSQKPTSRAGLVYQPTQAVDLYAQYVTGFKPNFNLQPDGSTLEPEFGRSVEVGQRFRLLQSRIQLNTAVFNITKRNVTFSRPGGVFEQVGKVRSRGFEADLDATVTPQLHVNVGYGYTDAVFVDYRTTLTTDLSGNKAPRTPPHTVSVNGRYMWNDFTFMAGTQFRDTQFLNDQNTLTLDAFSLLNLAASYNHGSFQYNLSVQNVTDAFYYASIRGNAQFYPGEPRRVTATVNWNFR
ncbi:MAG: TonB-dependent siderophore receptor [Acidimicrobiia bacterium]|nr:TonB-dependent siderophore receptor [Acidimicrobiia bacterium]